MSSTDVAKLSFAIYPVLNRAITGFHEAGTEGIFESYMTTVEPIQVEPEVRKVREAGKVAPVKMGAEVALAPEEPAFATAARWSIRVPEVKSMAEGEILLRLTYQGDVARIYAGGRLIDDDFYHGAPWEIGLRQYFGGRPEAGAGTPRFCPCGPMRPSIWPAERNRRLRLAARWPS